MTRQPYTFKLRKEAARSTSTMYVPPNVWPTLIMGNRLVGAYKYEGEPQYSELETLFKDPGVEGEFLPAMNDADLEPED